MAVTLQNPPPPSAPLCLDKGRIQGYGHENPVASIYDGTDALALFYDTDGGNKVAIKPRETQNLPLLNKNTEVKVLNPSWPPPSGQVTVIERNNPDYVRVPVDGSQGAQDVLFIRNDAPKTAYFHVDGGAIPIDPNQEKTIDGFKSGTVNFQQ